MTQSGECARSMGDVGQFVGHLPGQQLLHAIDRMIGDAVEDVAKIGFRLDTALFGRANERQETPHMGRKSKYVAILNCRMNTRVKR